MKTNGLRLIGLKDFGSEQSVLSVFAIKITLLLIMDIHLIDLFLKSEAKKSAFCLICSSDGPKTKVGHVEKGEEEQNC